MPYDLLMNGQGPVRSPGKKHKFEDSGLMKLLSNKVELNWQIDWVRDGLIIFLHGTAKITPPAPGCGSFGSRQHHNLFYAKHNFKVADVKAMAARSPEDMG